jgi:membrane protein
MLSSVVSHIGSFLHLFRKAFRELEQNDPLRMAGATAFFTTFALPPILVILIQVLKGVVGPYEIRSELFSTLSNIIGEEAVIQIQSILRAFRGLAHNWYITAGGFIFLLFVATTLFKIIKGSINQIWKIGVLERKRIRMKLKERLQAIIVILIAGFLFAIGLLVETSQAILGNYMRELFPRFAIYFNGLVHIIISVMMVTTWFAMLFRMLPDGRPSWHLAFIGGFVTSLLFNAGKVLLRWLLTYSNLNNVYGTSSSIVLILLFVFYSSLILYYGAAFTKVLGIYRGEQIVPKSHAVHYRLSEVHDNEE